MRPIVERSCPGAAPPVSAADPGKILERLYASRGLASAEDANTDLAGLLPIGSLENTGEAVDLLLTHRESRIVVVGDFDADGATSAALMLRCLGAFGFAEVSYLVPNRFDFGYGLSPEIVAVAAQRQPALLITVDNGISSIDGVRAARDAGIDVLVTDHHLPGPALPDANVIVNPNLPGSRFGSRNLAGVGVAFYVLAALGRSLAREGNADAARVPAKYLDLVALGTVADVVPLDRNNRILVEQGLKRIRAGRLVPGLRALLELSGRRLDDTVSTDLGFVAGPRINASGRLEDISVGIECLLSDDPAPARELAATLDAINRERREIEAEMREQAFDYVERMNRHGLPSCVCLFDGAWHQGVVGLIAARVRERCHRPAVAFARERDGVLKGSARSVPGVHARDLLEAVDTAEPGLIEKFGGHAMAAGLSLKEANFDRFRALLSSTLVKRYPEADFSGAIVTDGELPDEALTLRFARTLRQGGPWGCGFPEPVWHGFFDIVEQRTVGERHLKLKVQSRDGRAVLDAIAFNQAGPVWRGPVQLAYRLDVNEYRGNSSAQLVVEQISADGANAVDSSE
ncbi:MAG: single-stranded-DNA-specific exonuclease RecJ [Pseudomonadota bacterium]